MGGHCVQTFVKTMPLVIFKETSGQFPAVFLATKKQIFFRGSQAICSLNNTTWPGDIYSCVCGDQNRYFLPNHDVFLNLTKWLLCLNLTRANAKCCDWKIFENWSYMNMMFYLFPWFWGTYIFRQLGCLWILSGILCVSLSCVHVCTAFMDIILGTCLDKEY